MTPNFLIIIDNKNDEPPEILHSLKFAVDNMLDCMKMIIPEPLLAIATFDEKLYDFTAVTEIKLADLPKKLDNSAKTKMTTNKLAEVIGKRAMADKTLVNILLSTGDFPTLRLRFEGPTYAIALGNISQYGQLAYFTKNIDRVFSPHAAHFLPLFALEKKY